jgi:hypothetical protein
MRARLLAALAATAALLCAGCPVPPTVGAKTQEAAQDLNMNARFGRMEFAAEQIAPKEREAWMESHRQWGGQIRIADTELAGVKLKKGGKDDEAEVLVKVAWYRPDENELHVTTLRQLFRDVNGEMKLVAETRADGDLGLLGEHIQAPAEPPGPPRPTRFPTIRIGGGDDGAVYRTDQ